MNHNISEQNENPPECKFSKTENEIWEMKRMRINEKRMKLLKRNLRHFPETHDENELLQNLRLAMKMSGF